MCLTRNCNERGVEYHTPSRSGVASDAARASIVIDVVQRTVRKLEPICSIPMNYFDVGTWEGDNILHSSAYSTSSQFAGLGSLL